jgi:hypothetical protein
MSTTSDDSVAVLEAMRGGQHWSFVCRTFPDYERFEALIEGLADAGAITFPLDIRRAFLAPRTLYRNAVMVVVVARDDLTWGDLIEALYQHQGDEEFDPDGDLFLLGFTAEEGDQVRQLVVAGNN